MEYLTVGDKVRWIVDVDKVYSKDTKLCVGTIGEIIEPRERAEISKYQGNAPGCYDVLFPNERNGFAVWDIPYSDLEKVE